MKSIIFSIVLGILTFTIQAQVFDFERIPAMERKNSLGFFKHDKQYDIGENYDLKYYRFFWEVDPAVLFIKGQVTSHFVITQDNTSEISYELSNSLTVDSIKYHLQSVPFTHVNKKINITLSSILMEGTTDSVTIYYHGVPEGEGGFSSFTQDWQNGNPIVWTLSQPYGSSDWWPCKNVLNDKIDSIDIYIKTPSQYKAGSNGLLTEVIPSGQKNIYHWKHRYPIETYLVAFAITNYCIYSNYAQLSTGQLEILNYVFPADSANAAAQTPNIIPVLKLYDSLFGAYPFYLEKYGHAQFGWGGGMEHQTMTFLVNYGFDLMAHELAHSWFGDAVTCGSWKDIWLNEGFATYLAALTYEYMFSPDLWLSWKMWAVNYITQYPDGSVYCNDTTNIYRIFDGRLSYNKGAYVLHMLRWVMGDDAFYTAVRNYVSDPQLRFAYAKTEDFISHVEQVTETDLNWFFDQWVYGEGYPSYSIFATILPQNMVKLVINQTQSHLSVPFFRMPVSIQFKNNNHDTIVVIDNIANNQDTTITLTFTPNSIIFDPDYWILSRQNEIYVSTEELMTKPQFKVFPNPVQDKLFINCGTWTPQQIMLTSSDGKLILAQNWLSSGIFELPMLSTGLYILTVQCEEGNYSTRVLKE